MKTKLLADDKGLLILYPYQKQDSSLVPQLPCLLSPIKKILTPSLHLVEMQHEISMLKDEIDFLQKGLRYMFGQGTVGHMTLDELQTLERHLEIWMYHIRSTKQMHIMFQEIQSLKNKEGILKTANEILQEKIIKQNGFFDEGSTTGDIGYGYPLTIQNGIFNF
ncbi:MADS-box transcription factor 26-like isoform X3 [Asparagus officinalis]|uniref:MADS-box transcription factor 26-like isoform X3 n=1 Tax=Asparagus officinalis TaxID=4686 RepID=UPI00098DF180|nr:MADS-box transcription factor 26-like isoform X3 [Asparagus officinalis]